MAEVFISYVHEDHDIAERIASFLRENGYRGVFFTGDYGILYAGEIWLERIREELSSAKVVLSLFSPHSIERPWVHFEAGAAWLASKVVIPVCIRGFTVNDLRIPYSGIQGVTLVDRGSAQYLLRSVWNRREGIALLKGPPPSLHDDSDDLGWRMLEAALKRSNGDQQ
jgi:hypothetical protein